MNKCATDDSDISNNSLMSFYRRICKLPATTDEDRTLIHEYKHAKKKQVFYQKLYYVLALQRERKLKRLWNEALESDKLAVQELKEIDDTSAGKDRVTAMRAYYNSERRKEQVNKWREASKLFDLFGWLRSETCKRVHEKMESNTHHTEDLLADVEDAFADVREWVEANHPDFKDYLQDKQQRFERGLARSNSGILTGFSLFPSAFRNDNHEAEQIIANIKPKGTTGCILVAMLGEGADRPENRMTQQEILNEAIGPESSANDHRREFRKLGSIGATKKGSNGRGYYLTSAGKIAARRLSLST
ncbi:MAG: hypothetical protein R3C05_09480 [Pirellulaceae bacterium]